MARRRRDTPTQHREFFRAVTIDETVALACTCNRGADHWYAEPTGTPPVTGTRLGKRVEQHDTPEPDLLALSLRALQRSSDRARPAW
ncbi:hypothetical protein [Agromyces laixinhei]|uniref:hypothetical protein n=1 Tax=Agromyces laixinhei TaxID=2585717 RepID=UPI001115F74B|nr:hypothetical protein [Agromyces laixinhei]